MRFFLALAALAFPTLILAQATAPTRTLGCIPVADAKSSFTPPELHKAVADCIAKDQHENAAELFALAGVYASFDAERVADKSAGQAKKIMNMDTFEKVPQDKKASFNAALNRMARTPEVLGKLCGQIAKVGKPDYHPTYMILHGMKVLNANPQDGALVKDFDAAAVWKTLQSDYLNCPS